MSFVRLPPYSGVTKESPTAGASRRSSSRSFTKASLREWKAGDPIARRALAVLWDRQDNETFEAVVDLVADSVESWTHVPGVTPNFAVHEFYDVDRAIVCVSLYMGVEVRLF